jgi:hypothetical protein
MRMTRALGWLLGVLLCAAAGRSEAQPTGSASTGNALRAGPAPTTQGHTPSTKPGLELGRQPPRVRHAKGVAGARGRVLVEVAPRPRTRSYPPGSFEALRSTAESMGELARTLEPFTELCNEERDMTRRQCEVVRGHLRNALAQRVFRGPVEPEALAAGSYLPKQGGRTVVLHGCVACARPVMGDRRQLITVRRPRSVTASEVQAVEIASVKIPHASKQAAQKWEREVGAKLAAELIYKLGPSWTQKAERGKARDGTSVARRPWDDGSGEIRGVSLELLGYRIYQRCTGAILASSPKSASSVPVEAGQTDCVVPEPKTRPPAGATVPENTPDPTWPYVLSVSDIRRTMDGVRGQVNACYLQFQIPGAVELEFDVTGMDGQVMEIRVVGKFEDTPTGDCVATAVGGARFPHFRARSIKIPYQFFLR